MRLSPRNEQAAADLASRFEGVSVAPSNQDVLDNSDTIVLAVRPQIARSVISELRFRPDHNVISAVATLSLALVSDLVAPAVKVTRVIPLPSVAIKSGPTAIYPPDGLVANLFAPLGSIFEVESESQFDALSAATSTMASYFASADSVASWLTRHGVPQKQARDYVAHILWGLANTAVSAPARGFQSLAADHATPQGLNEQVLAHLLERGVFENLSEALDAVIQRIVSARPS